MSDGIVKLMMSKKLFINRRKCHSSRDNGHLLSIMCFKEAYFPSSVPECLGKPLHSTLPQVLFGNRPSPVPRLE